MVGYVCDYSVRQQLEEIRPHLNLAEAILMHFIKLTLYALVPLSLAASACGPFGSEPTGSFTMCYTLPASQEVGNGPVNESFSGTVIEARAFAPEESPFGEWCDVDRLIKIQTEEGEFSVGYQLVSSEQGSYSPALDVSEGEQVTIELIEERPWWTESALIVSDDDGLVAAFTQDAHLLEDKLDITVSAGADDGRLWTGSCASTQYVMMNVSADKQHSVSQTDAPFPVMLSGTEYTFSNIASWRHEDVNCTDIKGSALSYALWR